MRLRYETASDRSAEREVAALIASRWSCTPVKLNDAYQLDYALLRDDKVAAWAEVKCRGKRYSTYMLSLHKHIAARELSAAARCPALLVVRWPDWVGYLDLSAEPDSVRMGGRTDRGDWQDIEPVAHFDVTRFRVLS